MQQPVQGRARGPRPFNPFAGGNAPAAGRPDNFPRVSNRGREALLSEDISFDEYIQEINGSSTFVATKFAVNPGLVGTFPKGSLKAALYSEWKCIGCEFYYKPEVSGFATQGSTGKVILAMDYNAGNPAPTTKQQVEIMHRVDDMPYEAMALKLDARSVNRSDAKYIRTGPIPVDEDIKTFDGGNLWVCTIAQTNTNVVGELHVRYIFRCSKPTLLNPAQGGLIANATVSMFTSSGSEAAAATGVAKQMLYATAVYNGTGAVNTAGSIVPPAGNYLVDIDNVQLNSGGNVTTGSQIQLLKNGTSVNSAWEDIFLGPAADYIPIHMTWYVSANGTDAFTVTMTNTYGSGSSSNTGTIRFVAV